VVIDALETLGNRATAPKFEDIPVSWGGLSSAHRVLGFECATDSKRVVPARKG
jgi:hypothetical protein